MPAVEEHEDAVAVGFLVALQAGAAGTFERERHQ
jgi:hypothetical protein